MATVTTASVGVGAPVTSASVGVGAPVTSAATASAAVWLPVVPAFVYAFAGTPVAGSGVTTSVGVG